MKQKIVQHIITTQDVMLNGHCVQRGRVIKNDGWITSSDGQVLSNSPSIAPKVLWKRVLKLVERGMADYIYSHINYLEDGEVPVSCNGCPWQGFAGVGADDR